MLRLLPLVALLAAPAALAQFAFSVPTNGDGTGYAVARAPSGALYLSGDYGAALPADFDPGPAVGSAPTGPGGFVARYDADGAFEWVWAATADFSTDLNLTGMDARPDGGAVVAGRLLASIDIDPDPDRTRTLSTADGVVVVALTAAGDVDWAFTVDDDDIRGADALPRGVAVDGAGNVYVAGYLSGFGSVDADPGPGEALLRVSGQLYSFVASYDASGAYRWAFVLGGDNFFVQNRAFGIAVDDAGVYITGFFRTELDFGGIQLEAPETELGLQGYVARYDPATGALDWATQFGRDDVDQGYAVTPDGAGGAFVTGTATRPETFRRPREPRIPQLFVGRFGSGGRRLWSVASGSERPLPSSQIDAGYAVAYDGAGRLAVGGSYYETQSFGGPGSFGQPPGSRPTAGQAFVVVLDAATGGFVSAVSLGSVNDDPLSGSGTEVVRGLAWADGQVVAGGSAGGTLVFPGGATFSRDPIINPPFLARFSMPGAPPPAIEVAVQERIAVTDDVDFASALRLLVREVVGVTDEADFRRALALLVQERVGVTDGFVYEQAEAVACAVGLPLGVGAFDADGTDPTFGEYAEVVSGAAGPVDLSTCSLVAVDPLTERVTFSASPAVDVLDRVVFATQSGDVAAPLGWLPDGPGAIALVEGAAPVGASVRSVFGRVLSAVVYLRDGQVFGRSGYTGPDGARTSSVYGDLAEVLAAFQGALPDEVSLALAGPNPVRQGGAVAVGLPEGGTVRVSVFDLLGREVARPLDAELEAGLHTVALDVGALPSGAYVVRLVAGGEVRVVRVTVAR